MKPKILVVVDYADGDEFACGYFCCHQKNEAILKMATKLAETNVCITFILNQIEVGGIDNSPIQEMLRVSSDPYARHIRVSGEWKNLFPTNDKWEGWRITNP